MFAMTCSKPETTNAVMAMKMRAMRASSELTRTPIQTARHTSALQSNPRMSMSSGSCAALPASTEVNMDSAAGWVRMTPEATINAENTSEPMRFMRNIMIRVTVAGPRRIARMSVPWGRTIIAEVARSAPAKTTRVSAVPNTSPDTSLARPSPAANSGPATLSMTTMPTPIYAPPSSPARAKRPGVRSECTFSMAVWACVLSASGMDNTP